MSKENEHQQEAPGQNKVFHITVNTRPATWAEKKINFRQVVGLAEAHPDFEKFEYTVTYSKGDDKKPKGTLTDGGDSVNVKDGMVFDVEQAIRS